MSEHSDADPDLSFSTAADLREASEEGGGDDGGPGDAFADLTHPERVFPRAGGMRYEGATVIELRPADGPAGEAALASLASEVLADDRYRVGDWFDLPLPVFLVHDDETGDTFRVAVREDAIELHVRSETCAAGLRAFRDRLADADDGSAGQRDWQVSRRTD